MAEMPLALISVVVRPALAAFVEASSTAIASAPANPDD